MGAVSTFLAAACTGFANIFVVQLTTITNRHFITVVEVLLFAVLVQIRLVIAAPLFEDALIAVEVIHVRFGDRAPIVVGCRVAFLVTPQAVLALRLAFFGLLAGNSVALFVVQGSAVNVRGLTVLVNLLEFTFDGVIVVQQAALHHISHRGKTTLQQLRLVREGMLNHLMHFAAVIVDVGSSLLQVLRGDQG